MKKLIIVLSIVFTSFINAQTSGLMPDIMPDIEQLYLKLKQNDDDLFEVNKQLIISGKDPSHLISNLRLTIEPHIDHLEKMRIHIKYFEKSWTSKCGEVGAMAGMEVLLSKINYLSFQTGDADLIKSTFISYANPSEKVLFLQTARTLEEIASELEK
jgi:hypothetical protein|tara:strand:+ start:59 stop:529 length:471 start_codon:yes stop_codon:yes gene_type:complete